jgi:hypothetical protein
MCYRVSYMVDLVPESTYFGRDLHAARRPTGDL